MVLNMNIVAFIHVECMCAVLNRELFLGFKYAVESLHSRERIGVWFFSLLLCFLFPLSWVPEILNTGHVLGREQDGIWSLLNSLSWVGFSGV